MELKLAHPTANASPTSPRQNCLYAKEISRADFDKLVPGNGLEESFGSRFWIAVDLDGAVLSIAETYAGLVGAARLKGCVAKRMH